MIYSSLYRVVSEKEIYFRGSGLQNFSSNMDFPSLILQLCKSNYWKYSGYYMLLYATVCYCVLLYVTACSLPLWHWKWCILPTENIYGLCITYMSKINRMDFVVKKQCVFCEIGPGILNITERNFGFESVTPLLRFCFFLIWLCVKEICGGVPITLCECPCLLRRTDGI
jgi:hypothetical protein